MNDIESGKTKTESGNLRALLFVCCLGQFMVVLDASIVNVTLPQMQVALDLSQEQLQWVINSYTVVFAGFLLLGGRLADLFGRRKVFLLGVGLFTASSLAAGLAQNSATLLIARGVEGLGGAILAPATLTILFTSFTDSAQKMKAFGTWSATAATAGACGALVGGVLAELGSWRWVFFVNIPIGILLFVLTAVAIPESRNIEAKKNIDGLGAVAVTGGVMALVYGVVRSGSSGWASIEVIVALCVGVLLMAAFVFNEKRATNPLVPLEIFKNRSVTGANMVSLTSSGVLLAVFFLMTLLLQFQYGYSAIETGLSYVPLSIALVLFSRWVAPRVIPKAGAKNVLILGCAVSFIGLIWFAIAGPNGNLIVDVLLPTVVFGAGQGLVSATVTIAGTTNVSYAQGGLVSGLLNASRQIGGALLLAVLAAIAGASGGLYPDGPVTPYHNALYVAAIFPLVGVISSMIIPAEKNSQVSV